MASTTPLSENRIQAAFNEWMRRFIEEPDAHEHEITSVKRFLAEQAAGEEPSYGALCAAYLIKLAGEVSA